MMKSSLEHFKKIPRRKQKPGNKASRKYHTPPKGTLIARVYSRITPLPKGGSPLNAGLGRDILWIPKAELAALLRGKVAASFRLRLALGHLRDNVRGEPGIWEPRHVRKADFKAKVRRVKGRLRVSITGRFKISAPRGTRGENYWKGPSGYEGKLEGELIYDIKAKKVTRFALYAEGKAWGEVKFTPGAPPGKFPLRIAFLLAEEEDELSRKAAPYAAGSDDQYLKTGVPSR